jgi:hypothetical protein
VTHNQRPALAGVHCFLHCTGVVGQGAAMQSRYLHADAASLEGRRQRLHVGRLVIQAVHQYYVEIHHTTQRITR